jgi:hypothetical protein
MNTTKRTALALLAIVSALSTQAQTLSTNSTSGVLGHRYSEVSFGLQDPKHFSQDLYDLSLSGNVPVAPNLDLGAGYSYGWIGGSGIKGHVNTIGTTATAYTALNGVKPFIALGLGYQWVSTAGLRDDNGIWGGSIGVEIPAGAFSVTPSISYADDFRSSGNSTQQTTYGVEGNYWLSSAAALFASVGYTDLHSSSVDSWNYRIGYRWKF